MSGSKLSSQEGFDFVSVSSFGSDSEGSSDGSLMPMAYRVGLIQGAPQRLPVTTLKTDFSILLGKMLATVEFVQENFYRCECGHCTIIATTVCVL